MKYYTTDKVLKVKELEQILKEYWKVKEVKVSIGRYCLFYGIKK